MDTADFKMSSLDFGNNDKKKIKFKASSLKDETIKMFKI